MATLNSWQRIDRVLAGKPWGDGSDGSATISSDPNTRATITGTATSTSGTAGSTAFANGDVVMLHQTRGTGAGQWEINKIASGGGTTSLTFKEALHYTYGTGAQIIKVPMNTTATISSHTPAAWNGSTDGVEVICAKTSVTGGGVNGVGYGFQANSTSAYQGQGTGGNGGDSRSANGNGGGGGNNNNEGGGGGGGGANTNNGTDGTMGSEGTRDYGRGGSSVGSTDGTNINLGGAGGTGGSSWGGAGGVGGSGGSKLIVISKSISITSSNNTTGANGNRPATSNDHKGGGGGGAGGDQLYIGDIIDLGSGNCISNGGSGANGYNKGGNGGGGSVGHIIVQYKTSVSGSTTPNYSSNQDTSLVEAGATGNFIPFFM